MSEVASEAPVLIRLALTSDLKNLIPFAIQSFTATFGHLYPGNDLADFIASSFTESVFSEWVAVDECSSSSLSNRLWIAVNQSNANSGESLVVGYVLAGTPCSLPHNDVNLACDGELKKCYVDKSQFGTGLADRLLSTAIDWLRKPGDTDLVGKDMRNIWLGCYSENYRAQKFYMRHGFKKVGEYNYIVGSCVDLEYIYILRPAA